MDFILTLTIQSNELNKNKTAFINSGHSAFPQIQMSWGPENRSNMSVQWFSQQHAGKKVGWHQRPRAINSVLLIKQFLSVRQLEYSTVDVVQLRFMQFHSLTSFQHMTIRCTSPHACVLGTANSVNDLIHLLGDSGNKIGSHLTTVHSGTGEVRPSELCFY